MDEKRITINCNVNMDVNNHKEGTSEVMSKNVKVGKRIVKFFTVLIPGIILFLVDLNSLEDKCAFLTIFKTNVDLLENIVETYSPLFWATIILIAIIWSMFKISISIKGVSFAGFDVALKDSDKVVKSNIKNYLNTKRSLFYIKPEFDNICEVFDSYHSIYDFLRTQLLEFEDKKRVDSLFYSEIQNMLKELNKLLTVHQSNYRRWFAFFEKNNAETFITLGELQKQYPEFDIMMRDIEELNKSMRKHAKLFGIDMLDWEYEKIIYNCDENKNNSK